MPAGWQILSIMFGPIPTGPGGGDFSPSAGAMLVLLAFFLPIPFWTIARHPSVPDDKRPFIQAVAWFGSAVALFFLGFGIQLLRGKAAWF